MEARPDIIENTGKLLPAETLQEERKPAAAVFHSPKVIEKLKLRAPRKLVPWTHEQKTLTKSFFEYHIDHKIPPKKFECEKLAEKYPGVFDNKTWPQIKVFVQNEYTKVKKPYR